jgi:hypothetical protein
MKSNHEKNILINSKKIIFYIQFIIKKTIMTFSKNNNIKENNLNFTY